MFVNYYYYFVYIYPLLRIAFIKVQSFKNPTSKFNFQSQNFHYSISLVKILCLLIVIIISYVFIYPLLKISFIKVQSFKIQRPNLIFNLKISTIQFHSLKYHVC